jgi:peptide-methionine (S)-S-oxide reductase
VSYEELLQVFFASHDPTTLNRQGNDVGTQYRSAIFVHSEEQANTARAYIKQLDSSKTWSSPIVTEVTPAEKFYVAEDYHQNYYNQNGSQPYCAFVVRPTVEKFKKMFGDKMRAGDK